MRGCLTNKKLYILNKIIDKSLGEVYNFFYKNREKVAKM